MEDFVTVDANGCFAAVYDGHGGSRVSSFLQLCLFDQICALLELDLDEDSSKPPATTRGEEEAAAGKTTGSNVSSSSSSSSTAKRPLGLFGALLPRCPLECVRFHVVYERPRVAPLTTRHIRVYRTVQSHQIRRDAALFHLRQELPY